MHRQEYKVCAYEEEDELHVAKELIIYSTEKERLYIKSESQDTIHSTQA